MDSKRYTTLLRYIVGYGAPTGIVAITLGKKKHPEYTQKAKIFICKDNSCFSLYVRDSPGTRLSAWDSKEILLAEVQFLL